LNLNFDRSSIFQKQPDPATSPKNSTLNGTLLNPVPYTTSTDFFKNVVFGNTLQVSFFQTRLKKRPK
jgi:hypothetical protein